MKKQFELHNVSLQKGSTTILSGINLAFEKGLVYAIVGPNGSGKTFLLRLLNLLESPSAGSIYYSGMDTSRADQILLRREMAFVAQEPVMFNCSVFRNVAAGLGFRGVAKSERRERVYETLRLLSLDGYTRRNARALSGGEKQKVAIARAFVLRPKVLLLDEPTANLDQQSAKDIEGLVQEINRVKGTTIILVTHGIGQAKRLSDEVVFLKHGRIVEKGKTAALLKEPLPEFIL